MAATLKAESTLTDRYQTTIPETVRRALKLRKRDKIEYAIRPDGAVVVTRGSKAGDEDPALERFLGFLAEDIARYPDHLRAIDSRLLDHIQSLIGQTEVNLDTPLSPSNE